MGDAVANGDHGAVGVTYVDIPDSTLVEFNPGYFADTVAVMSYSHT